MFPGLLTEQEARKPRHTAQMPTWSMAGAVSANSLLLPSLTLLLSPNLGSEGGRNEE